MIRKILRRMMEGDDINSIARDLGIERGLVVLLAAFFIFGGLMGGIVTLAGV